MAETVQFNDWRRHEFISLLNGINPQGRSEEACNLLRDAVADYRRNGTFGTSALSGWMKSYLDNERQRPRP
jgi:hypothetical protein